MTEEGYVTRNAAYSINEVVSKTGLGRSSIYEALASGALKAVKAGRRTIIRANDLDAFLASLPVATFGKNRKVA